MCAAIRSYPRPAIPRAVSRIARSKSGVTHETPPTASHRFITITGTPVRASRSITGSGVSESSSAPATDAHDWSPFADGFKNALDKPGAGWTVRSLQGGEERGRDDYEEALDHDGIRENLKSLIRDELLTRVENHITMLERLHRGIYPIS
jgi:hypothetical protein